MNYMSHSRPAKQERVSMAQQGMLETMIKHLYIRRFPHMDGVSVLGTGLTKRVARSREKKPITGKRK